MTISFDLSEKSIEGAIHRVELYSKDLQAKTQILVDKLAEDVKANAERELIEKSGFADPFDDSFDTTFDSLAIEKSGQYTRRVLAGGDAIWLEFGTGVVSNPVGVGGYAHPKAAELGMYGIGEYGHGWGANPKGWYYTDESGVSRHTYGIPATLFMYHSAWQTRAKIPEIARRLFKT